MKYFFLTACIYLWYNMIAVSARTVTHSRIILSPDDSLYNDFFFKEECIAGERFFVF